LLRNVPTRFTTDSPTDKDPVWSPDGSGVLYTTERGGSPNIFLKRFDNGGELTPMVVNPVPVFADDWSRDGNWIAYTVNTTKAGTDLWLKPLIGDRKERVFLNTRFNEEGARFSPDSRWLAFASNETGDTPEVYVARVDEPEQRVRISSGGGTAPRWRRDGKELFYAAANGRTMMVAPIESLSPFRAGAPKQLFTLGVGSAATRDRVRNTDFDVAPNGQRFLISIPVGQPASSQTTIVLNWPAGLAR
jgi:Tol biopolymer transport system component